jgi:hypothetical protein
MNGTLENEPLGWQTTRNQRKLGKAKIMRTDFDKTNRNMTFTIVELLTVMSITAILIGLVVPTLNKARRHSHEVKTESAAERHRDLTGILDAELNILIANET